jgi:hypothetical protein
MSLMLDLAGAMNKAESRYREYFDQQLPLRNVRLQGVVSNQTKEKKTVRFSIDIRISMGEFSRYLIISLHVLA